MKPNGLFASVGLLVLRIVAGGMMIAAHGWGKYTGFEEKVDNFGDPLGIGPKWSLICTILTEVVCSGLLIIGLGTRLASAALIFTFGVVVFVVHGQDSIIDRELPILYLSIYIAILATGPGMFSLDSLIARSRRKKKEKGQSS